MDNHRIVLIRGGGDLASGVALRLHRSGMRVVITELDQPLVIRRSVSFAEAVYRNVTQVEGATARLVDSLGSLQSAWLNNEIPVLVDPECQIISSLQNEDPPLTTLVDARMTKTPPSLLIGSVPFMIGLGPGFVVGVNCDAVVETNRGHYLGRVLWQGSAQTNFERALPAPQSELAGEILKDPYNFDFLELSANHKERELHLGLLDHIRAFLLELGTGFAFVGSEYHLEVGESDFYIDLLFYHLKLRSYVVIELKTGKFQPEYAGKMNFYLSAIDDLLRHPDDQPSIGIVLCKGRDNVVAEYALRDIVKPMGISGYELTKALPESLKDSLPTIEQLEEELDKTEADDD